jgi:hypothetical protein
MNKYGEIHTLKKTVYTYDTSVKKESYKSYKRRFCHKYHGVYARALKKCLTGSSFDKQTTQNDTT